MSRSHSKGTASRQWRMPWMETIAAVTIVAGTLIFLYPHIASWFSQKEQSRVTELALDELQTPPHSDERFRADHLQRARDYNAVLASGAVLNANEGVATGSGHAGNTTLEYGRALDVTGNGYMGRLKYDALAIDLPIYHGTDAHTLTQGVGHLEGTSLPVGGEGTRSVLTAHRGLPQATLFNELDAAEIGDTFAVTVLGQTLTYRVTETLVIDPDATEEILPAPHADMVTLITCTPLGVNSHRILVNAIRVSPTPAHDEEAAALAPDLPGFPWWALGLGGIVTCASVFVWRSGRRPAPVHARPPHLSASPLAVTEPQTTGGASIPQSRPARAFFDSSV